MTKTIARVLASVCADDDSRPIAFPFSEEIDGRWYDCATNGHIALLVATGLGHGRFATADTVQVPKLKRILPSGGAPYEVPAQALLAACKAAYPNEKRHRLLALDAGGKAPSIFDAALLERALSLLGKKDPPAQLYVSKDPLDPLRVEGKGWIAVAMPWRGDAYTHRFDLTPYAWRAASAAE